MERRFLESLGIEKEAIDKIMAENGKDIEVQKALTVAETQKVTAANDTIKQLREAVKKFDGKDPEKLSADLAALQKKYDADTAKLRLDNALDVAIIGAKGRSTKAVKAFLDYGKMKLKDDGTIDGLDLEALKKSEPYLFEAVKTDIIGGGDPGGGNEPPAEGEPPKDYAGYKKWREKHQ